MRLLVFILIFANLLFFAYSQGYFGEDASPDAQRVQKQINPDRMVVLEKSGELIANAVPAPPPPAPPIVSPTASPEPSAGSETSPEASPPASPPPSAPPPVQTAGVDTASACTLFSITRPEAVETLVKQATLAGLRISRRTEINGGWWVFIPPAANRKAAVDKTGELLALGVSEYFIVSDGPQQYAISLGVFSQEESAKAYLEQLRGKGVRSARIEAREADGMVRHVLEIRGDAIALMSLQVNEPEGVTNRDCR